MSSRANELAREQAYVDGLYARLDALRTRTTRALAEIGRASGAATPQNRSERDAFAALYEDRLAQLRGVEDRLCFGRLDLTNDTRRYIGRLGLADDEQTQLLVDWRAPAAEAFYQATAAAPGDVVRRRHLVTDRRVVTHLEDEVLDLTALATTDRSTLSGEGALMASIAEHRTGHMRDIVATIQAEQDRVIRADLGGVLVVDGGPGTGKTAVALHRAAYLLYAHRERLAGSAVLLVGPNPLFLRYIEQVLPSLGETGVVMATLGELFPGVAATATDDPAVTRLKGDLRMVEVIARAVAARQRLPASPRSLDVDGTTLVLSPETVAMARDRARSNRKPHNLARARFALDLLGELVQQYAAALHVPADQEHRDDLMATLRDAPDVRREVNLAWMPLTPQRLLADLYAVPELLTQAAPHLSAAERRLLQRARDAAWTSADVPMLDEAAELLGEDDTANRLAARRATAQRREEVTYARGVLALAGNAGGLLTAETLADRYRDTGRHLTVAERAGRDRTWAFGHVVVDEAQELSAMAWRLLMRRCPSRSMTIVGDVAQTSSPAGAGSWSAVLDPYVRGRWRRERLTVNYRTPRQVMAVAADVLAAAGFQATVPSSVREGEWPPSAIPLPTEPAAAERTIADVVRAELGRVDAGRLAVITARQSHGHMLRALVDELAPDTVGENLSNPVAVLTVEKAKGLEFDSVVVIEPADLLAEGLHGPNDLYVALTRPTQRLRVLHARPLPAGLNRLVVSDC